MTYATTWMNLEDIMPSAINQTQKNGCCIIPTYMRSWRRRWHPTPVLLPGKAHGRRSLVGCSPWGRKESDTTERLPFHFSLSCIGEGHGNPLQCSCLGNPRDGGAWWAAIYGVAQSRIRLKRLSREVKLLDKESGSCLGWEWGMGSYCLLLTEFTFGKVKKFWRCMVAVAVQQCECT